MTGFIKKNINGSKVLLLFILTNIVYVTMLTITIPHVMRFSGGMKLPDMMPAGYDAVYVNSLFDTLGQHGRNAYLFRQLPLDMIYPFLFGISYCLLLAYFLNKLGKADSILFYLCLLPLVAGFFDYLENSGIILLLNSYPNHSRTMVQLTNIFTIVKSICTSVTFIILIFCILLTGIRKIFRKSS